jgi:hypothetical protein
MRSIQRAPSQEKPETTILFAFSWTLDGTSTNLLVTAHHHYWRQFLITSDF